MNATHGLPRPGRANGPSGDSDKQNILLGRIEQSKYVSELDNAKDLQKLDEEKRRARLENADYNLFTDDNDVNSAFVTSGNTRK